MATGKKGTFAALQQLTPLPGQGEIFREGMKDLREIQATIDAKKEAERLRKEQQDEKIAALFDTTRPDFIKTLKRTPNINSALMKAANKNLLDHSKLFEKIKGNPSLYTDIKTREMLSNIENYPKYMESVFSEMYSKNDRITKGVQDGTLSVYNLGYLDLQDAIFKKSDVEFGKTASGIPMMAVLDKNGNLHQFDFDKILQGDSGIFAAEPKKINLPELVKALAEGAKLEMQRVTGTTTSRWIKFSDVEQDVRKTVKERITVDGGPSDLGLSIWSAYMNKDFKIVEDFTDEDMKQIEDYYVNRVDAFFP